MVCSCPEVGLVLGEKKLRPEMGTWLLILVSTFVPLFLVCFFIYQWYSGTRNISHLTTQFVQRQNNILAYDAMEVSHRVSSLLEGMSRDMETLAMIEPSAAHLEKFYQLHSESVTALKDSNGLVQARPLPLYNEIVLLESSGAEAVRLLEGKLVPHLRTLSDCNTRELCDRKLRETILTLPVGELYFGNLMRWYSPEAKGERNAGASFNAALRTRKGAVLLGLDYRHLREVQNLPVFPYERKKDTLTSYLEGNYVYFVDANNDFFTHPKHWHISGVDPNSGERVPPILVDSDEGTHPLNISAYRGERLKKYFERLLSKSFANKSVDIFRAPNLGGTNRVLSVAPILFSRGQYSKTGIFGHVILGCSVDYFEEPKETLVPYY